MENGTETLEEQKNAATLKQLAPYVKTGNCILFLGECVHAPAPEGSPYHQTDQPFLTGASLSKILADECQYAERFPNAPVTDLQRVSLYYENTLKRGPLIDSLAKHLTPEVRVPTAALNMLAALPFKIIVTTNYDPYLERALQRAEKRPIIRVYDPDPNRVTVDIPNDPT